MKIITVIGARPQFIKAAALSSTLQTRHKNDVEEIIVHTGQHFDESMSEIFFTELGIPKPKYNLGVHGINHGAMTGQMLIKLEEIFIKEKPQGVLVYGDTNSTLAGGLAASKLHIPVFHVEAGLRSFNNKMPEEINRILTDHLSDLLFTPTIGAAEQLMKEGISLNKVKVVGDIMFDSAIMFGKKQNPEILNHLGLETKKFILATCHRAENTDDLNNLGSIFKALSDVSQSMPVVLPLHPRTKNSLERIQFDSSLHPQIKLIPPQGYVDMLSLEKNAALIVTDSGGVQKEAFFFEVPCVTMREQTEWPELIELGWNRLASPGNALEITNRIQAALGSRGRKANPYGSGTSNELILKEILSFFNGRND